MIELYHLIGAIVTAGTISAKILKMLKHESRVVRRMAARAFLIRGSKIAFRRVTGITSHWRGIIANLMPDQAEACHSMVKI